MRTLSIILLIVFLLLLVIPLGVGMVVMGGCPDCQAAGALSAFTLCLALVAGLTTVALAFAGRTIADSSRVHVLLLARSLDRPPRSFSFGS